MEAAVHSILSELEDTIKRRVEGVLSCVDQKTWGLRKELIETIDETQVALMVEKTSLDTWAKFLQEIIADMKNDPREVARTFKAEAKIGH
jgi:Mg/Co/Ni transporter MgtE